MEDRTEMSCARVTEGIAAGGGGERGRFFFSTLEKDVKERVKLKLQTGVIA